MPIMTTTVSEEALSSYAREVVCATLPASRWHLTHHITAGITPTILGSDTIATSHLQRLVAVFSILAGKSFDLYF